MEFFLYVAWPFILPYYLVKTRGLKRTLLTLLLITVVYVGAFLGWNGIFQASQKESRARLLTRQAAHPPTPPVAALSCNQHSYLPAPPS